MTIKDYGLDLPTQKKLALSFVVKNKAKYRWVKDHYPNSKITKEIVKLIEKAIDEWYDDAQGLEKVG